MNFEECSVCTSYDNFELLVEAGHSERDAFHIALNHLVEHLVEASLDEVFNEGRMLGKDEGADEIYSQGFEDGSDYGYKQGVRDLEEVVSSYSDMVHEAD